MKILCLVHDDKFIDDLIVAYDRFGVMAEFIVLVKRHQEFKYITNHGRVRQIVEDSSEYCDYAMCSGFDYVWVHYATMEKMRFVARCPVDVRVIWSTWGGDYISLISNNIYEPLTLVKWIFVHSPKEILGFFIRRCLTALHIRRWFYKTYIKSFLNRVLFFSTVLPTETPLVEQLLSPRSRRIVFHYADNLKAGMHRIRIPKDGHSVLVGNSATYSNNTFDALYKLSCDKSVSKVICPLSYGESVCRNQIDKVGQHLYGNRWNPLFDFLPKDDYFKLLCECDVFVFNHIRQQAIGNIRLALKMGGLVILNDRSPSWEYYKSIGVKVYSTKQLLQGLDYLVADYGKYRDKNVELMFRISGSDAYASDIEKTFRLLDSYIGEVL